MKWGMQVLIDKEWKWVSLNKTHMPYLYNTQEDAYDMLTICYPDQVREIRLGTSEPKVRVKEWVN